MYSTSHVFDPQYLYSTSFPLLYGTDLASLQLLVEVHVHGGVSRIHSLTKTSQRSIVNGNEQLVPHDKGCCGRCCSSVVVSS